jgi:anti-sigma factor RsiW
MKPHEHTPRLLAYLDQELSLAESTAVEEHLEQCPACRTELEGLRLLERQLAQATPRTSEELWPGIAQRLPRQTGLGHRVRWSYALLVLLGLGLGAWAGWTSAGRAGSQNSLDYLAESSLVSAPQEGYSNMYLAAVSSSEKGAQP